MCGETKSVRILNRGDCSLGSGVLKTEEGEKEREREIRAARRQGGQGGPAGGRIPIGRAAQVAWSCVRGSVLAFPRPGQRGAG